MVDISFSLTVAGIAMSFAGFAGLMNTLGRRGDGWAPMDLYQLRINAAYAIATLFARDASWHVRVCGGANRSVAHVNDVSRRA